MRAIMPTQAASHSVEAWTFQQMLFEQYTYSPGTVEPVPKHSHEEYQFGLSFDCQGEYDYQGALHRVPPGSLSLIQSGEAHAPSERRFLPAAATFHMLYVTPAVLQAAIRGITHSSSHAPVFPTPVLLDAYASALFLRLHRATQTEVPQLEQDSILLFFLTHLLTRHAQDRPVVGPTKRVQQAIVHVRDFLHEHYSHNVSLQELAQIADLSPSYLCRAFRQAIGVPPHVYQIHVRIDRAKQLLTRGVPLPQVAHATGFYDQSHFGQHFKRLVGVTPGSYVQKDKNVLYTAHETE